MEFEQVFDNLTFKRMDIMRKRFTLSSIKGFNYFGSTIWFALISTRDVALDNLLLPRSSSFLHCSKSWGLWFQLSHICDL